MALSGTITGTCVCNNISGSNYTYELVWSATQNVSANTSTITVNARVKANSSYYSTQTNWTSIINGSTVGTFASTWVNSNGWTNLGSKTYTVNHNSDGTCSTTISGSFSGTYNGANVLRSGSASATVTLNTIPRASSFTLNRSSATIGSDAITLNISRASSNFTHKIKVGWGGTWYLVGENIATSHSFTPPMSYCNSIPNATSGTATVKVETLNNGSWIGEASKTITLNVPSSVVPSVSIGVTANSALSGHDVAGKTTFTVKANSATGSYGSTIKSYSITGGGLNSTSSSATTGTLGAGSYTFTVKVTDSRGRTASASKGVTVHGYSKPSASFNVYRANSSGSAQNDGTYVYAKITTTITNIANANVNDKSYSIYWKNPSDTSWKTLKGWTTISDYSKSWNENLGDGWVNTQSYDVRIQIRDSYETITIDKSVSTLTCVLNIEQNGVGIGKIWENGKLDVAGDVYADGKKVSTDYVGSLGLQTPPTGRNTIRAGVHTYNRNSGSLGDSTPSAYWSILGFGNGSSGSAEIATSWTGGGNELWFRSLRDYQDNWYEWKKIYHSGNKPTASELGVVANPIRINSGANLNDYQTAGFYYCPLSADASNISNVASAVAFSLLVEKHAGVKQTFTTYDPNSIKIWVRSFYNGSWGSWQRVMDARSIKEGHTDFGNKKLLNVQAIQNRGYEYLAENTAGTVFLNGAGDDLRLGFSNTTYIRFYKQTVNHYSLLALMADENSVRSCSETKEENEYQSPFTKSQIDDFLQSIPLPATMSRNNASPYEDTGEGMAVDLNVLVASLIESHKQLKREIEELKEQLKSK